MDTNKEYTPRIGKFVLDSLSINMYDDCRSVFREYIQNSTDAIDNAVKSGLLEKDEGEIYVNIDRNKREITVEDNATGVSHDSAISTLTDIANSSKRLGSARGFRGIGRIGGLGYCEILRFETSYSGEPTATIITWDAKLCSTITHGSGDEDAVDVLKKIIKSETKKEDVSAHYFRVIMEGVTESTLLDVEKIRNYLSMVMPVALSSNFTFRTEINRFMKEKGLTIDTYNIYVNGDQIYKPYTNVIYQRTQNGKIPYGEFAAIYFLFEKDENGDVLYWGWYLLKDKAYQLDDSNIAKGIRLLQDNIQIGSKERCKDYFKEGDKRFLFYYEGEIHAINKRLVPNARRDNFEANATRNLFVSKIKKDFDKLQLFANSISAANGYAKAVEESKEIENKIEEKTKNGFTSDEERKNLFNSWENKKKAALDKKKNLDKYTQKAFVDDSTIRQILDKVAYNADSVSNNADFVLNNVDSVSKVSEKEVSSYHTLMHKPKMLRTDRQCYNHFSPEEKDIINRIYSTIVNSIPDEKQRETLISKIEEDLTK